MLHDVLRNPANELIGGMLEMKEPFNLSIEGRVIKEFKKNVERVGLSASGVIEVFMRGMLSDEPLDRMKRFIDLTTLLRKEITR